MWTTCAQPHTRYRSLAIITKRKGLAAVGCVALIATFSAACGSVKEVGAEMKVKNAVDKLSDRKGATAQLSVDATADQIWAAMRTESGFTRTDAAMLARLRLTMTVSAAKPLKDIKANDKQQSFGLQFSADSGKTNAVEFRSVNKILYVRADVKEIAALGGAKGEDKAILDSILASADSLPSSLRSVKAALQGKWVSIDPAAFLEFAKSLNKQPGGTPIPVPSASALDPALQKQLTDAVSKAITDNAKFADAGSKDGVDHVKVTLAAGKAVRQLVTGLKPLAKQIPGLPLSDLNGAPDKNVVMDLAVKDGSLSGVTIDLTQLNAKPSSGKVPLHLALSGQDTGLKAPSGAQTLNPQDLLGAVAQMAPGLAGKEA